MRIAFDQQIFQDQVYGGISRYFCRLVENLNEYQDVDARIFCPVYRNQYIRKLPSKFVSGWHVPHIPKTYRLRNLINYGVSKKLIERYQPDILHETYYSSMPLTNVETSRVITVYDMIHEKMPQLYTDDTISRIKRKAIERSEHVICISENTRRDLIEYFDIPSERTTVVYLGYDNIFSDKGIVDRIDYSSYMDKPFILFVGSRRSYKNFSILIRAYASSTWLRNNFNLVCFGGEKYNDTDEELLQKYKLKHNQIIYISGDDEKLAVCYKRAAVFVYPSLYEGFGIPPLEAMSAGCPVVCSNTSSIPEVVGDAGEYIDPEDPESITSVLENLLNSTEKRKYLVDMGYERCKRFNWKRCASETIDIYRKLI